MDRLRRAVEFGQAVLARVRRHNVTFMAGSIAYQAFVSLLPLLVLTIFFLSAVSGEQFAARAIGYVGDVVSPGVEPFVRAAFQIHTTVGASVIGLVTLLWGSFRVFRGLDTAFSEIYGTQSNAGILDQVVDGVVAVVALLGALLATTLAATAVATLEVSGVAVVTPALLVVGLVVAFLPMYWRFPDTDVSVRATVPGVVVAALGWAAFQVVFEVYVAVTGQLTAARALGAMLLLLVWLYFDSLILLLGAVVNAVVADREP